MAEETLTPEETAALEEMEQDSGEGIEAEAGSEPDGQAAGQEAADTGEEKPAKPAEEGKPPEGYVPHQAMHAERLKRQEIERKLAKLEEQLTSQQPAEEQPPKYVDPLEDPEGFRKYNEWQTKQLETRFEKQQEALQQQQRDRQVFADVQQSEAEFAQKAPDYQDAVNHLYQTRATELQNMGYGDQEIKSTIAQDTMSLYQAAKQVGMNPAEFAYMRAQSLGYQPQAKGAPAQQAAPQGQQGEAEKMQALSKAQEATSGIGASGAPQDGGLTVAQLAKMSEDEIAKIPDAEFKKVMGG